MEKVFVCNNVLDNYDIVKVVFKVWVFIWYVNCGIYIYIYVLLLKELINIFINYIFGLIGEMVIFEN